MSTLNVGKLNCTGNGVKLPTKTTGTLPTAETGLLVFNSTTSKANIYDGTAWTEVGGGSAGGSNTQVQYNSSGSFAGSSNLTFDGTNLTCGGNITANSDERIKTNIKTIENALETVISLRGVEYNRTDLPGMPHQIGVIAQEVESIVPEVVHTNAEGLKSVSYGNLVALLIESVKELKQEIDELKGGN
jgi:hypothetical protein